MKIGLSYSRCVKDIVDGRVDIDDVLIIIARTDFDPHDDQQWKDIWDGYGGGQTFGGVFNNPEWMDHPAEDELKFRNVSQRLWNEGKLHQPRKFGSKPVRRSEIWLEAVLPSTELEQNPAAKSAWEQFQTVAGLTNVKLNKKYK
jgi:hypothetical protein